MEQELRVIVSGGGTGGHIFPAVSIANAIKSKCPNAKILFVGALGRMEMQRVPDAGYEMIRTAGTRIIRPLWSPRNIGVALDFLAPASRDGAQDNPRVCPRRSCRRRRIRQRSHA